MEKLVPGSRSDALHSPLCRGTVAIFLSQFTHTYVWEHQLSSKREGNIQESLCSLLHPSLFTLYYNLLWLTYENENSRLRGQLTMLLARVLSKSRLLYFQSSSLCVPSVVLPDAGIFQTVRNTRLFPQRIVL